MSRDNGAMSVEYEMTAEDVVHFQKYAWRHKQRYMHWFGFVLALATGLALGLVLGNRQVTIRWLVYYLVLSGVFFSVWSIFIYGVAPRIAKRMVDKSKNLGLVGKHIIRLESDGFRETTDVNDTFHAWRGVDTIEADARYIYIFLHGGTGHAVPRRAFASAPISEEFIAIAKSRHAASVHPSR